MSKNLKEAASNRRRFERVEIDFQTGVFITDKKHKRIGLLRQLGRGGMMVEPERTFKVGKKEEIFIVDVSENLKVHLHATVRYADARRVVKLLAHLNCKVNLIALNPGPGIPFETPDAGRVLAFQAMVRRAMPCFIRKPRGRDIFAACGQLKRVSA